MALGAARRHLETLAGAPRAAGSDAEARARAHCAQALRDAGFEVRDMPFEYSAAVGRYGMPAAGALWVATLVAAAALGRAERPSLALLVLVVSLAVLVWLAPRAARRGVLAFPALRRQATNLVATRGVEAPTLWLVAHVDSKSQPVPMMARVVGVASCAIGWLAAAALAAAQALGAAVEGAWAPLAWVGSALALPVVGSVIGNRSPGALDNASGVAAVLLAATEPLGDVPPLPHAIGVLVTSAEEVGLAGARAWARDPRGGARVVASGARPVALNVDSVDDVGEMRVMIASPLTPALGAALDGERAVRRGRLPAGVLVDAIALADEGFAALTVSRATVRSLARIHTPSDSVARLRGEGIVDAARLLRRLASASAAERS